MTYFVTSLTIPEPQSNDIGRHAVNDISASSGTSSPQQAVNSMSKRSLKMEIYVKKIYLHIFSFFLVFKNDFTRRVDFIRIAVSNTASDDVIN